MKTLFLFVIMVFGSGIFAQVKYSVVSEEFINFHGNVSSAERMFKNDSLLQAYGKYDYAFSNYNGAVNPRHYYRAALCAIKIKEEFDALKYIEKAIVGGYELDSAKKAELGFYNKNTKKEYLDNIASWEETRLAARNSDYENELKANFEANKKYTSKRYTDAVDAYLKCLNTKNCSKTTPEFLSKYRVVKEKMKADSMSAAALLNNINAYGFPTMKLVGKKANEIAHTVLLNYDADRNNEQLDAVLYKALLLGNISPEFYASVVDRRRVMSGELPEFYEPLNGYEKTIVKFIGLANKQRRAIGLYPIKLVSTAAPKSKDPKAKDVDTGLYDY
jgi:hypothetical protein